MSWRIVGLSLDTGYLRRGVNKGIEIRGPEGMKPRLTRLVNQICRYFTVAKKRVNAARAVKAGTAWVAG